MANKLKYIFLWSICIVLNIAEIIKMLLNNFIEFCKDVSFIAITLLLADFIFEGGKVLRHFKAGNEAGIEIFRHNLFVIFQGLLMLFFVTMAFITILSPTRRVHFNFWTVYRDEKRMRVVRESDLPILSRSVKKITILGDEFVIRENEYVDIDRLGLSSGYIHICSREDGNTIYSLPLNTITAFSYWVKNRLNFA